MAIRRIGIKRATRPRRSGRDFRIGVNECHVLLGRAPIGTFDGSGTRCAVRMTDTTCAAHAPHHAAPATRSAPRLVSMSSHAADVPIVLANPSAQAAPGQPQGTCHAVQTEAGKA
ncbi:MAG: hypothetical protein LBJ65_20940 [Burkholderia sp.]|jgi:hypothetical protein|uniref:hypothetical protein n=1 Tax=Burkholderia sp. TaxID=36773 RepID=UPI00282714AB|nr:hypothetical protein [Burkholderia sp.]MDR0244070.1 hypothetical protein [Burkholderia sp.]